MLRFDDPRLDRVEAMIRAYYNGDDLPAEERASNGGPGRPTGGNLHVVLDDMNWQHPSVIFCREEAVREGDAAGVALADALLDLTDDERRAVVQWPSVGSAP